MTSLARRVALSLALLALVAGTAIAGANQSRGKSNRAAILKKQKAAGETGRIRTRFVRDTGKSSLVEVTKLDGSGKPTGEVEAFLVDKQTGAARRTSAALLTSKKAKPVASKSSTASPKVTTKTRQTRIAAMEVQAPSGAAGPVGDSTSLRPAISPPRAARTRARPRTVTRTVSAGVLAPMVSAARSAVMSDPVVRASRSVAAMDPEAITPAEARAMAIVEQRLKVTRGSDYDVVPTFEQSRGDKSNPVTGSGVVELRAVRKVVGSGGRLRRFLDAFNPSSARRVEIAFDADGKVQYTVDRPDGLPFRIVRNFLDRVPVGELTADILRSEGVRKGGLIGALGGTVAFMTGPVGVGVAVAIAPTAFRIAAEGVRQRQVARQTALKDAVTEIKAALADGKNITLDEAYESYKGKLSAIKEGEVIGAPSTPASAISLRSFVKAISAPPHNL